MKPVYISTRFQQQMDRRQKARERKQACLFALGLFLLFIAIAPAIVDGMEKEQQWRADRLCRIDGVCDPKAGP